jgi:hypothetical protein
MTTDWPVIKLPHLYRPAKRLQVVAEIPAGWWLVEPVCRAHCDRFGGTEKRHG